jgi:hypothetical protein
MKGLRLLLISVTFVGAGCRTPATRTVIQRPFSEVKTEVIAFVKSHEEKPKTLALNVPPFLTFGTNAADLKPFFQEWTNQTARPGNPLRVFTLEMPAAASAPKPEFRIVKIEDDGKRFKMVFLWLQPLNSFGVPQVEIEARPGLEGHTRLSIHASSTAGPGGSSSGLICRDQYRETETLLRLCHSMNSMNYKP